ncbi:MAG: hypothetical protein QM661_08125 [Solimonas sp.]
MPTPAALFAMIFFSLVGLAAVRYGRKWMVWEPIAIGVALMVYPYFVAQTWLLYVVGLALCASLYVLRPSR